MRKLSASTWGLAVIATVCAAGAVDFFFGQAIRDSYRPPDLGQMRAFRVSKLTDDQLLALKAKSVLQFESYKRQVKEDAEKNRAERNKRQQECDADPVVKLRTPDACKQYSPLLFPEEQMLKGFDSADAFFESLIMGGCEYMDSVRNAKLAGCLPQL